ncbi:MAG: phospholipid carrier-dependent glycosyltransferase [Patescibacteria group bacterium]|nr:phospholipid carrier-dependent glycosyltransferase [Patescibacteria group bacterium]MDE2172444.1 phospholipid carrier-dependent glycosyltransferase [Patescibacteria group bacterium]
MISLVLLIAGGITHFFRFGFPAEVVFDEVYYGNFTSDYLHGLFFFDQHPPLVKLMLAGLGYLIGAENYNINWSSIGNSLPSAVLYLRLLPMVAGILLPLTVYWLCRKLSFDRLSATLVAGLLCLDNSLVVQGRFILPDVMLLLCGFGSLLFYFMYRQRRGRAGGFWLLAAACILAAATLSIKWTGLTFLFLIICLETYDHLRRYMASSPRDGRAFWREARGGAIFIISTVLVSAAIYISLFAIHFKLLPNSGSGDAFMTASFQATLHGNHLPASSVVKPETFSQKFLELNNVMYSVNKYMTATHSYSSKWYTWPLELRPIFYWQGSSTPDTNGQPSRGYIYLLGNPLVYWLGTSAMIGLVIYLAVRLIADKAAWLERRRTRLAIFLVLAYLANWLPFILIGRVMFLYHYETALIISVMAVGWFAAALPRRARMAAGTVLLLAALGLFVFFAPLTYGTPLTDGQLQSRMWLASWR